VSGANLLRQLNLTSSRFSALLRAAAWRSLEQGSPIPRQQNPVINFIDGVRLDEASLLGFSLIVASTIRSGSAFVD
jgi:hypothetical protein